MYRRKDGRVVGEWEDATGRTRYMTSKTMSKREMNAAVRKKLQDRDEGIVPTDSEGLTVAEYIERWLESTRDTVGLQDVSDYVEGTLITGEEVRSEGIKLWLTHNTLIIGLIFFAIFMVLNLLR